MSRGWSIAVPAVLLVSALAGCGDGQDSTVESMRKDPTFSVASGADDEQAAGDSTSLRTRADNIDTDLSGDVESVMNFQVGGDGTGCGYEPVETFEGVYYRYDDPLKDLGFMEEGFIDGGEIGWPLIFCLPDGGSWTITVTRPDGSEEAVEDVTLEYGRELLPGDPTGTWRFTAEAGSETLTTMVEVDTATASRISEIDEAAFTARAGDLVSYSLAGFEPDTRVPVGLYESSEDGSSEATIEQAGTYLGQVEVATDETGAGILDLLIPEDLAPGAYYLVPDPGSEESQAVAPLVQSRLRADLIVN